MMEIKVGDYVYPHYQPQQAGKVIEVKPPEPYPSGKGSFHPDVVFKLPNGEVKTANTLHLSSFDQLIEDHRRKLKTHEALLAKLEAIKL